MFSLIKAVSWDLDTAPTLVASSMPSLNSSKVGIPRTLNIGGVLGLSSTLSLATLSRPAYSVEISSSNGAIILHGPHHSAQQSTMTGIVLLRTSSSKDSSVICTIFATVSGMTLQKNTVVSRKGCAGEYNIVHKIKIKSSKNLLFFL